MLVVEDPDHPEKLTEASVCLAGANPEAAAWGAVLAVHSARYDPRAVWEQLRERAPVLATTDLGDQLAKDLAKHGRIWLD